MVRNSWRSTAVHSSRSRKRYRSSSIAPTIDYFWEKLSDGGTEVQCGWLKDKFGISWQVVPTILDELLRDPDPIKASRVMEAMLKMIKIDIAELKRTYEG